MGLEKATLADPGALGGRSEVLRRIALYAKQPRILSPGRSGGPATKHPLIKIIKGEDYP
jgi:hypothetical protein